MNNSFHKKKIRTLDDLSNNWCSTNLKINNRSKNNKNNRSNKNYKTELCKVYAEFGMCNYGDKCQYAHNSNELLPKKLEPLPKAYKSVLCRNFWSGKLVCPYGKKCKFIHNEAISINHKKIINHKKYKSKECRLFNETGSCPYGDKCAFIHRKNEDIVFKEELEAL